MEAKLDFRYPDMEAVKAFLSSLQDATVAVAELDDGDAAKWDDIDPSVRESKRKEVRDDLFKAADPTINAFVVTVREIQVFLVARRVTEGWQYLECDNSLRTEIFNLIPR